MLFLFLPQNIIELCAALPAHNHHVTTSARQVVRYHGDRSAVPVLVGMSLYRAAGQKASFLGESPGTGGALHARASRSAVPALPGRPPVRAAPPLPKAFTAFAESAGRHGRPTTPGTIGAACGLRTETKRFGGGFGNRLSSKGGSQPTPLSHTRGRGDRAIAAPDTLWYAVQP